MITRAFRLHLSSAAAACALLVIAGSADCRPVTYRLTNSAAYTEGCFELCLCPIWFSAMTGRFRLTPVSITGTYDVYEVSHVNWNVSGTGDHITGGGTYTVFSEFAALNRLELDLVINADDPIHFDSGMVPVGAPWPRIKVTVAMNGEPACYDIRLNVAAKPLHADINGDGVVGIDDLLSVIHDWGDCPPLPEACPADIVPELEGDRQVNVDDLIKIVTEWG